MTSSDKISVGILGASGYTGGELIRLLLHHPFVDLKWLYSRSHGTAPISGVHRDLLPWPELRFTDQAPPELDLIFLCAGHGVSKDWLADNDPGADTRIIDLSSDFRLNNDGGFVYGLPEWRRNEIKSSARIANPGCFATAIQLGLLPFLRKGLLPDQLSIHATTGSTGAGRGLSETTHFTWRESNLSVYKAFSHQHENEINQLIQALMPGYAGQTHFIPQRGNYTRGILANLVIPTDRSLEDWSGIFQESYRDEAFVHLSEDPISVKDVVNTNHAFIHLEKGSGQLLITVAIDNLLKGASGQAVQNMNLIMGWDERTGLQLKPLAY